MARKPTIGKIFTLVYLVLVQYELTLKNEEDIGEMVISSISDAVFENKIKILPLILTGSKMNFLGVHTLIQKVILQDTKISKVAQEILKYPLDTFEDIISSSSSNIGYTKLIEMDIETYPNLIP